MKDSRSRPFDFTQRVLVDVLSNSRPPDAHAVMLHDMTEIHAFRHRYEQEHGIALSDLHCITKAVAQTLRHAPSLNSTVKGYRVLVPENVDVGVSVATGRSIAPVTVIQRAEQKSLREIHDELKAGAQRAIESERRESASGPPKWHRYARFAPNFLRRGVIRGMANTPAIKRSKVGTVQITSIDLDDLEFYLPTHLGTATLISVGGTKLRPMVVNGQVEARPSAYIAFSVDQRVVTAVHSLRVFRRFKRLMQQPHRLEDSVEKEITR